MEKSKQRKEMIKKLQAMDLELYRGKSDAIIETLMSHKEFKQADTIGVTISAFPEVDTRLLIEACWQAGKTIAVPRCDSHSRTMTFHVIKDFDQLETVYMKLMEPIVEKTVKVEPEELDLLIVPGVVFARDGYRIGFGGGYYDRYLAGYDGMTISLAFSIQLVDSVPVEAHDIAVHHICTEMGCCDTGKEKT